MKKLLVLSLLVLPSVCTAQDADLFQTWYVNVLTSESYGVIFSDDVDPPIEPILTIGSGSGDTVVMSGFTGCNEFVATYIYHSDFEELHFVDLTVGDLVCEDTIMQWENNMTNFFVTGAVYQITNNSSGQVLVLSNFIFETLGATNYILDSKEFDRKVLTVHPNPTNETLNWINLTNTPMQVRIYSTQGKLVMSEASVINSIEVAALPSGLYFVELQDGNKLSRTKFIKR
ncbi:MAG: T9SS type A sorting domain-containing protein [Gilvibacter sp.]